MTNTPIPDFARVVLSDDPQYMTVWFHWRVDGLTFPLERPCSQGMSCLPRHVPRLIRAFLEGNLFENPHVASDVNGARYIAGSCRVFGKRINKDLSDLGY
jgi:hypothetical protein